MYLFLKVSPAELIYETNSYLHQLLVLEVLVFKTKQSNQCLQFVKAHIEHAARQDIGRCVCNHRRRRAA